MKICALLGSDFDETIALTFTPPPDGLGVQKAYERAIADVFGEDAVKVMDSFRTQSPRELAAAVQEVLGEHRCVRSAQRYHARHEKELEDVMPLDAGAHLDWSVENTLDVVTEVLIRRKLVLMLPNIGKRLANGMRWPQLTLHFDDAWTRISEDWRWVTAILSSGHEVFIRRVFEINELSLPDVLITDDYLRRKGFSFRKPDIELWWCAWEEVSRRDCQILTSAYVGDDEEADGGLAYNARVPFYHFTETPPRRTLHQGTFSDWNEGYKMLYERLMIP